MVKQLMGQINRKLLFTILLFLGGGIIFGFFATSEYRMINLAIKTIDASRLKIFILTFSQHYWTIFLLWFCAFIPLGFMISYAVLFGKGFILGVTLGFIIKAEALFGVYSFFKLILWQIVLLIPLTIFIAYNSVLISLYRLKGASKQINLNSYVNRLIIATVLIVLYSFIMTLSLNQIITP